MSTRPPFWTHEETLSLIEAYRDKWFSVNRGNLRAADWDAVATSVTESSLTHKSSLQCRHKIEKLRKRYRIEKKRCLDYPGRFFSSWDLFPLLDAMSIASSSSSKRCRLVQDHNTNTNDVVVHGFDPHGNVAVVGDVNSVSVAFMPKDSTRVVNGKFKADQIGFHSDYESGVCMNMGNSQESKLKDYGKISGIMIKNVDGFVGFPLKTLGDVPSGLKFNPKSYTEIDGSKSNSKFGYDVHCTSDHKRDTFGENITLNGLIPPPPGFRQKNNFKVDETFKLDGNSNGIGDVKKSGVDDTSNVKKVMDPIWELVSAISLSTKSFVEVEKMKMEMTMEIEKIRMETMLKHNKMILESQQQIVDAFAKTALGNMEKKKKRKEMEALSPCQDRNGETRVAAVDCESSGKSGIAKEEC